MKSVDRVTGEHWVSMLRTMGGKFNPYENIEQPRTRRYEPRFRPVAKHIELQATDTHYPEQEAGYHISRNGVIRKQKLRNVE